MSKKETPQIPPEIKADKVLDSVLGDNGAMPTARLGIRSLAIILDCIFITIVTAFIVWKIAIPQAHPAAFSDLNEWIQQFTVWVEANDTDSEMPFPELNERLKEAIEYTNNIVFLTFWTYFAIGEAFFSGRSFGKAICRLRSISTVNLEKPPFMSAIVRGGLKTIALVSSVALIATVLPLFFNKRRQTGHDLLSRTAVIDEKYIHLFNSSS